jgi:hypothetical protein
MRLTFKRAMYPAILALAIAGPALGQGKKTPAGHTAPQNPPIQLGTSGGNADDIANGYCTSGTLGALLADGLDNYFILSNSHVLAHDIVPGGNGTTEGIGSSIIQPGLVDTQCQPGGAQVVGTLASLSSIDPSQPFGNVDAAVGLVAPGLVNLDGSILEIGTIGSSVVGANARQAVKKSGRTTGLTKSTVHSIYATVNVQYDDEPAGATFIQTFTNQILVKNGGRKFLDAGDSGSLLVEDVTTNPRPVGLLFAGSNSVAVANPASDVLGYLSGVLGAGSLHFVGGLSPAGAQSTAPPGLARALAAQQRNSAALLAIPGSVGHAISEEGGQAIIRVLVEWITPEAQRATPARIDGVTVILEAVGRIVAF